MRQSLQQVWPERGHRGLGPAAIGGIVPLKEHFRRRPLTHVRELGFLIEETQRLKLGIVERVCARKAGLVGLAEPH